MSKIYLAYGSNMNLGQMTMRCSTAKKLGVAMLENYELAFKGMPDNAHLTIEKKQGKSVPVVLFEIKDLDEQNLDFYEGYPSYYICCGQAFL